MNTSPVSIDQLRTNLSELMGRVMYGKDRIFIKKYNREAAVLLSIDEYEKLIDPRKRFSSKTDWNKFFILTDKIRERMSPKDQENFEKVVDEEVKAVRAKRQIKTV